MARMVAPINSRKHYVQRTNDSIASAARTQFVLVNSVASPATSTTADVVDGSVVKAIFLESWGFASGATGTSTQFVSVLEKAPSGTDGVAVADMTNLSAYDNKKNILYVTQGNASAVIDGAGTIPLIRNWFKIPKGKQRMGLGDRILYSVFTVGSTFRECGFATFKEYR